MFASKVCNKVLENEIVRITVKLNRKIVYCQRHVKNGTSAQI